MSTHGLRELVSSARTLRKLVGHAEPRRHGDRLWYTAGTYQLTSPIGGDASEHARAGSTSRASTDRGSSR